MTFSHCKRIVISVLYLHLVFIFTKSFSQFKEVRYIVTTFFISYCVSIYERTLLLRELKPTSVRQTKASHTGYNLGTNDSHSSEWQGSLIHSQVKYSARTTDLLLLDIYWVIKLRWNLAAAFDALWQFTQQGSVPVVSLLIPSLLIHQTALCTAGIAEERLVENASFPPRHLVGPFQDLYKAPSFLHSKVEEIQEKPCLATQPNHWTNGGGPAKSKLWKEKPFSCCSYNPKVMSCFLCLNTVIPALLISWGLSLSRAVFWGCLIR